MFELTDAPVIAAACRDPDIVRWTFMPERMTVAQARDWIERAHDGFVRARALRLAIVDASDGSFIGQVGVGRLDWQERVGEVFYWVAPHARRRGGAARAARCISQWSFDVLNLARVELTVDPENVASQGVAERAGFTREGVLRSYQRFKGGRMDAVMYSRLPSDP